MQTQWRYVAGARIFPTGLDYASVAAAMKLTRWEKMPEDFAALQILEAAYLAEAHKRANEEAAREARQ